MPQINSEFSALIKREFEKMLARVGVPILCNNIEKLCITTPIDEQRQMQNVGASHHFSTQVDILADDYDEWNVVLNDTQVVLNEVTMTIFEAKRDPQDPVVHFSCKSDY